MNTQTSPRLETLAYFARAHGNAAWVEAGVVVVVSAVQEADGTTCEIRETAKTMAEVRVILGY